MRTCSALLRGMPSPVSSCRSARPSTTSAAARMASSLSRESAVHSLPPRPTEASPAVRKAAAPQRPGPPLNAATPADAAACRGGMQ
jgi:hypothetical protein